MKNWTRIAGRSALAAVVAVGPLAPSARAVALGSGAVLTGEAGDAAALVHGRSAPLVAQAQAVGRGQTLFRSAAPAQAGTQVHGQSPAGFFEGRSVNGYQTPSDSPFYATFVARDSGDEALGATFQPLGEPLRSQLKVPPDRGLIAVAVEPEGPSFRAGIRAFDVLLTLSDKSIASADDLKAKLKEADADKELALVVLRKGESKTLKIRPVTRVIVSLGPPEEQAKEYALGIAVEVPDESLRAQINLPAKAGLVVNEVLPKSAAEKAEVQKNDILLSFNDKPLTSPQDLIAYVNTNKDKPAQLEILHGGQKVTRTVTPEKRSVSTKTSETFRIMTMVPPGQNAIGLATPRARTLAAPSAPLTLFSPAGAALTREGPKTADLEKELKELRKAVEELRDALKASRDGK